MKRFVLDASIVVTWALRDEHHSTADHALENLRSGSAVVPGIWWYEVRNVLLTCERRGRISAADCQRFLAGLQKLRISIVHDLDEPTVLDLARRFNLTVYDSAYLALAIRENLAVATLDTAVLHAARSAGVPVWD